MVHRIGEGAMVLLLYIIDNIFVNCNRPDGRVEEWFRRELLFVGSEILHRNNSSEVLNNIIIYNNDFNIYSRDRPHFKFDATLHTLVPTTKMYTLVSNAIGVQMTQTNKGHRFGFFDLYFFTDCHARQKYMHNHHTVV